MKGRIKELFKEENHGIITDEKGEDRYFHFEQVIDLKPEKVNILVEFVPAQNEQQELIATQVTLLETLFGKVTILNERGFGFITDQHKGKRWFHFNDIKSSDNPDSIKIRDRVLFTPFENEEGSVAENIFLLDIHPVQDDNSLKEQENKPPLSEWDSVSPPVEEEKSPNSIAQPQDENHSPLATWDSAHPPIEEEKSPNFIAQPQDEIHSPLAAWDSAHPPVKEEKSPNSLVQPQDENHSPLAAWDSVHPPVEEKKSPSSLAQPQDENYSPLTTWDLVQPQIKEETSQQAIQSKEKYLLQLDWGSIYLDEDKEQTQLKISEYKQKKPTKKTDTQQPIEAKQVPASESRIYHKDKEYLDIIEPVTIRCNAKEKNGLFLENCHHVTIENVQIQNSELACLRIKNCHHVTIKNCIFERSQKGQGIQLINSFEIRLENITCRNNGDAGVEMRQGCRNISILSSTVLGNVKAALRITDGHHVILNNGSFGESAEGAGILLANAFAVQLENITCRKNANVGVEIEKGCYDISILSSKLLDNAEAELRMIEGNNITGCELRLNNTQNGNGIWLREVQEIQFENCHFDNNEWSGIYLENCFDGVFTNSTFSDNIQHGIHLQEAENIQFRYCKFNDNQGYGLNTVKSENISLLNPKIHFNKKNYGNLIGKSSVEIMDCDLQGKGQFILSGRSTLKTNLRDHSGFFKKSFFKLDSDSDLKLIK